MGMQATELHSTARRGRGLEVCRNAKHTIRCVVRTQRVHQENAPGVTTSSVSNPHQLIYLETA